MNRMAAVANSYEPMPIIVGFPRSGTTLLRLMLDAHPKLAVTHETGFIPRAAYLSNPLRRMFYRRLKSISKHRSWAESLRNEFYQTAIEMETWDDFHISSEDFHNQLLRIEPFTITDGLRAFFRLYAARFNKPRWGDKTPFYSQYLRTVEKALPEAHFIHIIRDGRDAALSGKGMPFVGNDLEAIGRRWSKEIRFTRGQSRTCRHYLEIRYEDLVVKTTDTLQKICAFINLQYEPQMEEYYQNANERLGELGAVSGPNNQESLTKEARLFRHRLTAQPPLPTRIGRWRELMTRDDLSSFNQAAGPVLQELGYEL